MPSTNFSEQIADLQRQFNDKLPPVEKWDPKLSGDIDIRIDREGRWFHEGDLIKRESLIKIFSSVLKREGEEHFLVTPVEKWRIKVDVAPFFITSMQKEVTDGKAVIAFKTSVGSDLLLGPKNPLWLEPNKQQESVPLVLVRNNLTGLISRSVYYELVETSAEEEDGKYFVESLGERYWLN